MASNEAPSGSDITKLERLKKKRDCRRKLAGKFKAVEMARKHSERHQRYLNPLISVGAIRLFLEEDHTSSLASSGPKFLPEIPPAANPVTMNTMTYLEIAVALLGPLQYGLGMTMLNTMLEALSADLGFDKNGGGAVASAALFLGAVVSCLFSGPFEKMAGRYTQANIGLLSLVGALLCAFSTDSKVCWGGPFEGCVAAMLVSGRVMTGCAAGLSLVISPKYLAEVSPPEIRGALGACSDLCIGFGVFIAVAIGLPYEFDHSFKAGLEWWRVMFLMGAIPAILQVVLGVLTAGPSFRNQEGAKTNAQNERTRSVQMTKVSDEYTVAIDLSVIPTNENDTAAEADSKFSQTTSLKPNSVIHTLKLCCQSRYRLSVILGIGVPVVGNLIGICVICAYSTTIFEDAGLEKPILGSIAFGVVGLIGSVVAIIVFDRYGRTTMAYFSFGGMFVSFVGLALSELSSSTLSNALSFLFLMVFVFVYSTGCGPLTVAYAPEVVPPEIAEVVLGLGQSLSILTALILVLVFPALLVAIGALLTFLILSSFCLASLLFLKLFMVETKGKSLNDVLAEIVGLGRV